MVTSSLCWRGAALAAALALSAAIRARSRALRSASCTPAAPCAPYSPSALKRCLLLSNSKLAELPYLAHALPHIRRFLAPCPPGGYVAFVPYAQRHRDGYAAKLRQALAPVGLEVRSLHECAGAAERLQLIRGAAAVFVGGGNSYRLLKCLQQDEGLLREISSRVASGKLRYIGSSAGTNLACPTIRNTNDMPIVWPSLGLHGLCLIPFQINTHYIDEARELQNHMGETRAKRLEEFVEENDAPVLALREGSSLLVEGETAQLLGPVTRSAAVTWEGARLVRRAADGGAREVAVGESLDFLMKDAAGDAGDVARLFDVSPLLSDEGQDKRRCHQSGDGFKSG